MQTLQSFAQKYTRKRINTRTSQKFIISIILNLSGGEPFLRKDLFEILDYTTKFDDIVITTNCTLINEKIAQKLAQYPNVRLSISIDGMEEIHDKFRGRKGTFQKIINTLPILKENGVKF